MICRKITYKGNLSFQQAQTAFSIIQKNDVQGSVTYKLTEEMTLILEGDASYITLSLFQIEKNLSHMIKDKKILHEPFHGFSNLQFIKK
jgi:hypothetical protein